MSVSTITGQTPYSRLLHNLRNQLNNISLNAELARMELTEAPEACGSAPAGAAPAIECINTILAACARCAELVDGLTAARDTLVTGSSGHGDSGAG